MITTYKKTWLVRWLFVFLLFTPLTAHAGMFEYLAREDDSYRWEKSWERALLPGVMGYELRLTSQTWKGITWRHRLRIIVPASTPRSTRATLLITGSGGGDTLLLYGRMIAMATGTPLAILHDVPNQPLFAGLREDALIAHTFQKFLETGNKEWPLLFPMTKSAVRAMDAIQEFLKSESGIEVTGFMVTGMSKRGWTTWLSAAVDNRVEAIAPMVYDNLNLPAQMRHQIETWGAFSEAIRDYTARNLPQLVQTEAGQTLARMVDPYAYLARITVPTLIILGTNDVYWPLDALNLYYHALVGKTYILYVPNAGHDLAAGLIERVLPTVVAFFHKVDRRMTFPRLSWEFEQKGGAVRLSISSDMQPSEVNIWVASSETRDFRRATWHKREATLQASTYVFEKSLPEEGYAAFFGEIVYQEKGQRFFLSTNVRILGRE
jgi:PhoPQ-activated pathogenicity-related protein